MSTALDGIRRIVEIAEPVNRMALLSTIVISALPISFIKQFPLSTIMLERDEALALMLIDQTEFQVGVELPQEFEDAIDWPLLIYRTIPSSEVEKPFERIWLYDLWKTYLIQPEDIQRKFLEHIFKAFRLMPTKLDPEISQLLIKCDISLKRRYPVIITV